MKKVLIDLGCGKRKQLNHIGVDRVVLPGVDIVCDLDSGLPFKTASVDGVYANFLFEHSSDFIRLVREVYRICRNGSLIRLRVPYWSSFTQWKDPTHRQVVTEETFRYFSNEDWYGSDYRFGVNFRTRRVEYVYLAPFDRRFIPEFLKRFMRRYFLNIVHSMWIELEVLK
jgi:SAM-dependent methyltransferase